MQSMQLQMMASLQSMGQQMAWQHASIIGLHKQQAVMANRLDLLLTTIVPEVLARLPSLRPASVQPRNSQPSVISEPPSLDDRNALAWAHDTTLVPEYRQLWWDAPEFVPIVIQRAREWTAAISIQSAARVFIAKTVLCRLRELQTASHLLRQRRLKELRAREQKINSCAETFVTYAHGKSAGRRPVPLNIRVNLPWSGARPSTITVVSATIDGSRSCPAPSFELSSEVWPPLPEPSPFVPIGVGSNVTSLALRPSSVAIFSPLQDFLD